MNRVFLDKWCERGMLGLVLAILVGGPLALGAVNPPAFLVLEGLTLGVILLWGLRLWLSPRARLLWPPICWAVAAFAVYAIGRYRTAEIEYVARQELIQTLVCAFLFFAILNNLHRQESTQTISLALIFLALGISGYAIGQFLTHSDHVWGFVTPYTGRGCGTYICPNHLAGLLEMVLPLGMAYMLLSRVKTVTKVFIGYASLVILGGIAVSLSRGGWFATALMLLVFFTVLSFRRTHRLPSLVLLGLLLAAGAYLGPKSLSLQSRLEDMFPAGKISNQRFELWRPAVELWRENIWWGIGPAHFNYRFHEHRPADIQLEPDRVHNDILNTLVDWGIVGAAIVTAAWVLLYAGVFKTWRYVHGTLGDFGRKQSNKLAFVFGASLGLLAILFHSALDFNMHIPANAILAVALMALLTSHLRYATERYWITPGPWTKIIASVLLLAGLAYLGNQTCRAAREWVWLNRAAREPNYSPTQAAALKQAFAAEPMNPETAFTLGEVFRIQSWEGGDNYRELAQQAMEWYARGIKLNRFNGFNYLRYGMCLDWLGRHDEAGPYFNRADEHDPSGYYTAANIGWHFVQVQDYAAARSWLERSWRLEHNLIAESYLQIVNRKIFEAATNAGKPFNGLRLPLPARTVPANPNP